MKKITPLSKQPVNLSEAFQAKNQPSAGSIKFWIVLRPTKHSDYRDVCYESNPLSLLRETIGGLEERRVVGFFKSEAEAKPHAEKEMEEAKANDSYYEN